MCRFIVALLISIVGLGTTHPLEAKLVEKVISYSDGKTPLEGFLVYDDRVRGRAPGVLLVHDWLGLTDKTKDQARRVARLKNVVVFAADIYGRGVRAGNPEEASRLAGQYRRGDRDILRRRAAVALEEMRKQRNVSKSRVAAIGYCFGGGTVLELARSGAKLKGVVSFHGNLDTPNPADAKKIQTKVLVLHGADDPYVPWKDVTAFIDEMKSGGVDYQLIAYGNAVHSFTDRTAQSDGAKYDEHADKRSWKAMQAFFKEIF